MKTLSGMIAAVTMIALSIWFSTSATACVVDGQPTAPAGASSESETQSGPAAVEKVRRRIEELKVAGVRITEPAEGSVESIDIDSLPKHMREITLVTGSRYLQSSGNANWNLVLADGATRVELSLFRDAADEPFMLLDATIDGQRVFASDVGFQESARSAVEVGNTYEFTDPAAARNAFDALTIDAMETVLTGNGRDIDAPQTKIFASLEPAAALGLFVGDEGATLFFDETGMLLLVNRGERMVAVLTAKYMPPTGGGIYGVQRDADEGVAPLAIVGPSPAVRVCQRLFHICLTHEDDLGLRACELWLKYCAPKPRRNLQAMEALSGDH